MISAIRQNGWAAKQQGILSTEYGIQKWNRQCSFHFSHIKSTWSLRVIACVRFSTSSLHFVHTRQWTQSIPHEINMIAKGNCLCLFYYIHTRQGEPRAFHMKSTWSSCSDLFDCYLITRACVHQFFTNTTSLFSKVIMSCWNQSDQVTFGPCGLS